MTDENLEAMQQEIADTAPKPLEMLPLRLRPSAGRLASIMALTAIAGTAMVPDPFANRPRRQSFTERHGLDRQWAGSEEAQSAKIADAKAKRSRKAAKRRGAP